MFFNILFSGYKSLVYSFISLFSIINPIGMSAIFYSYTSNFTRDERKLLAKKVFIYGSSLLISVFLIGTLVLNFFGISLAALQVAGGLLIFSSAWQMLNEGTNKEKDVETANKNIEDIAFFPITMPLTTGAGSMAITVALFANISQQTDGNYYFNLFCAICGIIIILFFTAICYAYSEKILNKLGKVGNIVVTRLTAFILTAIGVTIVWSGLRTFILGLH